MRSAIVLALLCAPAMAQSLTPQIATVEVTATAVTLRISDPLDRDVVIGVLRVPDGRRVWGEPLSTPRRQRLSGLEPDTLYDIEARPVTEPDEDALGVALQQRTAIGGDR